MNKIFLVYSYRQVFYDHKNSLHACMRVGGKLLVFTKTPPKLGKWMQLPEYVIEGPHFSKKRGPTFLTLAYNQKALRFGNKLGGWLEFTPEQCDELEETFRLQIDDSFNPNSKSDVNALLGM